MNIAREAREKLQFTLLYRRKRDQRDGPVPVFGYNRPLNFEMGTREKTLRGHGDSFGFDLSKKFFWLQREAKTPTQYVK